MVRILEKYSWHLLSKDLSYLGPVYWFEVGAKLTTNINTEVTDTATVECPRVPMLDGGRWIGIGCLFRLVMSVPERVFLVLSVRIGRG